MKCTACDLDYYGKSYRFGNVIPVDHNNLTIGIIRFFLIFK